MKNLFYYATKELSQDAFLRWLFENYNCENESVRLACRKLFESFTSNNGDCKLDFNKIVRLETVAQWKNIDIIVRFEIDGKDYIIAIEDKTESNEHNQLEIYNKQLLHSDVESSNIFKIFYKTNIIDLDERQRVENQGWKIYDIYDIVQLFGNICATNEVLMYYIDYLNFIIDSLNRTTTPDKWNLNAWHSFYNDYKTHPLIDEYKEIGCYQKAYYYMALFFKNHRSDMPCLEIRSRDFKQANGKCTIMARIVLYKYTGTATKEQIEQWQASMKNKTDDFIPSYRTDVSKHKQIGKIIKTVDNNEASLIEALNEFSTLLI